MDCARSLIESRNGFSEEAVRAIHWQLGDDRLVLEMEAEELVFLGVCSVFLTADAVALRIYEMRLVEENAERVVVEVKFRPGGTLTVNCGRVGLGMRE